MRRVTRAIVHSVRARSHGEHLSGPNGGSRHCRLSCCWPLSSPWRLNGCRPLGSGGGHDAGPVGVRGGGHSHRGASLHGVRGSSHGGSLGSRRTVKVHGMNIQITLAELAIFRESKLNGDRTTTLVVGDIHALGRTGSHLVTGGTICQLIVEHDIGVPGSRQAESTDGERSVLGVHTDGIVIISGQSSSDAFALFQVRYFQAIDFKRMDLLRMHRSYPGARLQQS